MLNGGTLSACAIAGTAVFKMVVSKDSMKNPTATNQGSNRLAVAVSAMLSVAAKAYPSGPRERAVDDGLRLSDQPAQMRIAVKTFGVDFVDVLGS